MGATDEVPHLPVAEKTSLAWDAEVGDAVAEIAAARERHGDEFAVHSGKDRYLFTFSPTGVDSFYALDEHSASKGVADYLMLRRKLPGEVFENRRVLPTDLFTRDRVEEYLYALDSALLTLEGQLGSSGEADLFETTRRLGHLMGLFAWAGCRHADASMLETLMSAFDKLDGSAAFVHPDEMARVRATDHAAERAAYEALLDTLARVLDGANHDEIGLAGHVLDAWSDEPRATALRGAAADIVLIHIASMSNLHAALGWLMTDLLENAEAAEAVRDAMEVGDEDLARRCALESTRLAQRSIMPRHVLEPVSLETDSGTHQVPKGWTIATLLPVLNTSAGPGLSTWDPERWQGYRLHPDQAATLPSVRMITAFGHGKHSCPALPFSVTAMSRAASFLLTRYDFTPGWTGHPRPVPAQIGGIARAADAVPLSYRSRIGHPVVAAERFRASHARPSTGNTRGT